MHITMRTALLALTVSLTACASLSDPRCCSDSGALMIKTLKAVPVVKAVPPDVAQLDASGIKARAGLVVQKASAKVPGGKTVDKMSARETLYRTAVDEANKAAATADDATRTDSPDTQKLDAARKQLVAAEALFERAESLESTRYGPWFRVHAGSATVSPYTVSNVTVDGRGVRELTTSTERTLYAEVMFANRTAWIPPSEVSSSLEESTSLRRALAPQDYEFRMGFLQDSGGVNGDAIDSSAEAATGDWYVDASIGWNLGLNNISRDGMQDGLPVPRGTYNLEFNTGLTTNRGEQRTNGYYQIGLATAWSIPIDLGDKKDNASMYAGVFYGIHEYARVDIDNRLWVDQAAIPYSRLQSLGVKVDFFIPLTPSIEAVVGGRYATELSGDNPSDDWSLFVGVTVPIGRWVRDLFSEEE